MKNDKTGKLWRTVVQWWLLYTENCFINFILFVLPSVRWLSANIGISFTTTKGDEINFRESRRLCSVASDSVLYYIMNDSSHIADKHIQNAISGQPLDMSEWKSFSERTKSCLRHIIESSICCRACQRHARVDGNVGDGSTFARKKNEEHNLWVCAVCVCCRWQCDFHYEVECEREIDALDTTAR